MRAVKVIWRSWKTLGLLTPPQAHGGAVVDLWPERVMPWCATDRSLAIARGIESQLRQENADGNWWPRATPTRPINELIRSRSSPAGKAALRSLIKAPA